MKRIVFIEGVSGVGKSTMTALLCEKLRDMGYKADCYLEGSHDNPLDPFNGTYPPPMPLSVFHETYERCWCAFAESSSVNDAILILDGTLLHHQINDLIRGFSASDECIKNHLSSLLTIVRQFDPVIFYMQTRDIGSRLAQAEKSRGKLPPTQEKIAFWQNRKRVALYVLERLSVTSHILDVDEGWNSIPERIAMRII